MNAIVEGERWDDRRQRWRDCVTIYLPLPPPTPAFMRLARAVGGKGRTPDKVRASYADVAPTWRPLVKLMFANAARWSSPDGFYRLDSRFIVERREGALIYPATNGPREVLCVCGDRCHLRKPGRAAWKCSECRRTLTVRRGVTLLKEYRASRDDLDDDFWSPRTPQRKRPRP